jgi:membrane-associated protease RseP (regulator of RpoE activity)
VGFPVFKIGGRPRCGLRWVRLPSIPAFYFVEEDLEQVELPFNVDILDNYVNRIFKIEDKTLGAAKQQFMVRYRGKLLSEDSAAAYDQLAGWMRPLGITPLFRMEDKRHVILLVKGLIKTKAANPWINLVLFIATIISVLITGGLYGMQAPLPSDPIQLVWAFISNGWPFAVSMIAILGAHEFGHYLIGRHHGLNVTLPYFIPMPFSPFGTMGAFINMKDIPKNRRVLVDVGMAGPLCGLIVAIPVLLLGLKLSHLDPLPLIFSQSATYQMEGNSVLYLLSKYLVFGKFLPAPLSYNGLSPVLYWLQYFFTGKPIPAGGLDVLLSPVAWAGWAGLLVTGLNLIPAGQLDGGHVLYVLFGKKWMSRFYPVILVLLVAAGFFWNGWWLWAAIIFFLGRTHAEPLDQITQLDTRRKVLASIVFILFFLTIVPVPLIFF